MDSAVKPQNDHILIFYLYTNFGTMFKYYIDKDAKDQLWTELN